MHHDVQVTDGSQSYLKRRSSPKLGDVLAAMWENVQIVENVNIILSRYVTISASIVPQSYGSNDKDVCNDSRASDTPCSIESLPRKGYRVLPVWFTMSEEGTAVGDTNT